MFQGDPGIGKESCSIHSWRSSKRGHFKGTWWPRTWNLRWREQRLICRRRGARHTENLINSESSRPQYDCHAAVCAKKNSEVVFQEVGFLCEFLFLEPSGVILFRSHHRWMRLAFALRRAFPVGVLAAGSLWHGVSVGVALRSLRCQKWRFFREWSSHPKNRKSKKMGIWKPLRNWVDDHPLLYQQMEQQMKDWNGDSEYPVVRCEI